MAFLALKKITQSVIIIILFFCMSQIIRANAMDTKHDIYKIFPSRNLDESQKLGYIKPLYNDTQFIHLATYDQIDKIVAKYWADELNLLIAKIDPVKITGELVYETNPGGTNKYYHLYNGKIPLDAIMEIYLYK